MKFATYKSERNLSELARRLFQIKGPQAEKLTKQAEAALLRANPQLRELKNLPRGTFILVPEMTGMEPGEQISPMEDMAKAMVEPMRLALNAAQKTLAAAISRESENASNTLSLLKSMELKALGKEVSEINKRLPKIAEKAKKRLAETETFKTSQEQAFAQIEKNLDEMTKLSRWLH